MRASLAVIGAVAALACAAAPASAVRYPLVRGVPAAGPVIDGDRTVWATDRAVVEATGGTARVAHRVADPDPAVTVRVVDLAASSERLAIGVERTARDRDGQAVPRGSSIVLSTGRGELETISDCATGAPGVALAGALLFTQPRPCGNLAVRWLDDPARPPRELSPSGVGVRAGGRFAAWIENPRPWREFVGGDVVVYDTAREAIVTRVTVSGGIRSFDVQDDGTLAIGSVVRARGRETARVSRTAAGGAPRRVRLPPAERYFVRIARGRILALRTNRRGGGARELLAARAGRAPALVADGLEAAADGRFDFDGSSVAWLTSRCRRLELRVAPLASLTPRPAHAARCPSRTA